MRNFVRILEKVKLMKQTDFPAIRHGKVFLVDTRKLYTHLYKNMYLKIHAHKYYRIIIIFNAFRHVLFGFFVRNKNVFYKKNILY